LRAGATTKAAGLRDEAIASYLRGFEADWRDAYPGINALQLIHEVDPHDPRIAELTPLVSFAVRRKVASGQADYWDHATLAELAVLAGDEAATRSAVADALATQPASWMRDTTADTLRSVIERGGPAWVVDIERLLRSDDLA